MQLIASILRHDVMMRYVVPAMALAYCLGLLVISYQVRRKSKAGVPRKG